MGQQGRKMEESSWAEAKTGRLHPVPTGTVAGLALTSMGPSLQRPRCATHLCLWRVGLPVEL